MSALIKIRFLEAGTWADHPSEPTFEVKPNQEKEVTARTAQIATEAGKAVFVGKGQLSFDTPEDTEKFMSLNEREEALDKRQEEMNEMEKVLDEDEAELSAAKEANVERGVELDKREEELNAREEELNNKPSAGPKEKAEGKKGKNK